MASGTFALDLKEFAAKVGKRADDACAQMVHLVAASVDYRSPVGNPSLWQRPAPKGYIGGHFRANWQLGVGSLPGGTVTGIDNSSKDERTGGATTMAIGAAIPEDAAGKVYYLANNLPYAQALEYGHSTQAPSGMVGITVTKFQGIVAEAVAAAKAANP